MAVKAVACELPRTLELPLSRLFVPDIQKEVIRQGIVASISGSTVWRWLDHDAIRPWTFRSWIFPRDPHFEAEPTGGPVGPSSGPRSHVVLQTEASPPSTPGEA